MIELFFLKKKKKKKKAGSQHIDSLPQNSWLLIAKISNDITQLIYKLDCFFFSKQHSLQEIQEHRMEHKTKKIECL